MSSHSVSPLPSTDLPVGKEIDEHPRKRPRIERETNGAAHPSSRRKTACKVCSLRKVKCDAVRPSCSICRTNNAVCEYLDGPIEKLTLEAATKSLNDRLDKLQDSVDELRDVRPERRSSPCLTFNSEGETNSSSSRNQNLINAAPPKPYNDTSITEPSRDFLQIPAHRTTADTVLRWEVFEGRYPENALIGVLFKPETDSLNADRRESCFRGGDVFTIVKGLRAPDEERIPALVDVFLQNVHTKNPILDVESLVKQARRFASEGLGWDAWSCLVLLACALGFVAKPFEAAPPSTPGSQIDRLGLADPSPPAAEATTKALQRGESCFVLACRRLGGLKHTLLGAQCHFYAGVYLMYTLRPLLSSQYFHQSSALYQLHMKVTYGIQGDISELPNFPSRNLNVGTQKQRRLEQCLYWSCFKSESEFRVELPLPQSEIASYHHPQMFPSPPSPAGAEPESNLISPGSQGIPGEDPILQHTANFDTTSLAGNEENVELRQHAKKLCNEEESWYYYLTEIALRRIGNRIINTFFRQEQTAWLNVKPLLRIALEFDTQVSSWSAHLPPAMQHYETTYTIRAPTFGSYGDGAGSHVSRELSWAIDNRLLEMRSWLYQPFLYYLIHSGKLRTPLVTSADDIPVGHHRTTSSASRILDTNNLHIPTRNSASGVAVEATELGLDTDDTAVLHHMITSGIECNLKILDVRSLRHRHHGLWYDLRSLMCASLVLLAVVKSGNEAWIPGGVSVLWGTESVFHELNDHHLHRHRVVGGRIGNVFDQFDYWSAESPDLIRHREVLEEVTRDVRELWESRNAGG